MEECTERISICSDSHSLLKAIQSGAHDTQSIHQRLDNREGPTTPTWVPGHNGLPGKEAAGELANAAATATDTPPQPISFATDAPSPTRRPTGPETAKVYEHFPWKAGCIATSYRADTVLLARLREGYTPFSQGIRARYARRSRKHSNTGFTVLRQHTFGKNSSPLRALTTDPEKELEVARATF